MSIGVMDPSEFRQAIPCAGSIFLAGDEDDVAAAEEEERSSSESSSIGKNSDVTGNGSSDGDADDGEVQSEYKGPLAMMEALEEVLPVRRGISNFYEGKSRSYTSLADATSSSSVKEIAKPENAYSRRRRNLLAFNAMWDKSRNSPLRSNAGGISKRPLSSSKSSLALAVAMSSCESCNSASDDSSSSLSRSSPPPLPPLHPQPQPRGSPRRNFSSWRSYSLADLQQCSTPAKIHFPSIDEKDDLEELEDYTQEHIIHVGE